MSAALRIGLVALALATSAAAVRAQRPAQVPPTWHELGPAPIGGVFAGRISAIAVSPTDANRYFVAGADSGVWRTVDGGSTWRPLTDHMPTTAIGALALDPSDESVLYAGTGEANYANHSRYGLGIYKSTDGGDTWSHLARSTFAGRCFARILVDPSNPARVFGAVTRAGGFPELAAAKGHPGATGRRGVFRSEDGGVTWTALGLPDLSATDVAMQPGNPEVLLAGVGRIFGDAQNGIYRSVDGGDSWSNVGATLPNPLATGRISIAFAPSDPQRAYCLLTADCTSTGGSASTLGAFRSIDGGLTWQNTGLGNIQASYGWYLSVVGVNPLDADNVYMGGLPLFRSHNAGSTWDTVTPPHVDLHAVAWDANGRLLAGDDGGVHRSIDGGSSWVALNLGLGTAQFYAGLSTHPGDERVVLGGTQDNGSNQRTTQGLSWTQVFGGDGGWTQIDQAAPNRRFVEFQGTGNLYRTIDSGGSFSYVGNGIDGNDRNCFLPPFLIDPTDSSRMFYGTHRLYRSTNGGSNWSAISPDLSTGTGAIRSLALAPSNPDVIWAATNDGNVQVSIDGGTSFVPRLSGRPGWPRVTRELFVHPTDQETVLLGTAAFGTDQVQRTTDGGLTWEALDAGLPDVPVNTVALVLASGGMPERIFAGTDSGLFVTLDDGASWKRYGRGLPNAPVIDVLVEPERNRLVVGTQGRGAWVAPLRPPGPPPAATK